MHKVIDMDKCFICILFYLVLLLLPCIESQEEEDSQREARRAGCGRELSARGAACGRAATETGWNESGDGGGAGGQTERGRKDIKSKGAGGAVHSVTEVRIQKGCSSIVLNNTKTITYLI